jgi:outer membrane protein
MNVKRAVLAAVALLLAAAAFLTAPAARVFAQAGSPAPASAQKIGILNVRQAVFGTAEGKQALAELQSQFAPRTNEIDAIRKQIDDLQKRLATGDRTLSDEEKSRLANLGNVLSRRLQSKQSEFEEDAQAAQGEAFDRIAPKMGEVMNRYARENNFTLIMDSSAQNVVIFATPQTDITQDIVKLYDQAYPVRAGAAPAQPGTPRPQPPAKQPATQKPPTKQP